MKRKLLLLASAVFCLVGYSLEITLSPGSLAGEIKRINSSGEASLVLKGCATSEDLTVLRGLNKSVTSIDMSSLIVKGNRMKGEGWFGSREFIDGELPAYMLSGTGVRTLALPQGCVKIGNGAFHGIPLTEISIPAVTQIGEAVFYGCPELRRVDMSHSKIKEVPAYAFAGCVRLEEVKLPSSLYSIGGHAFENTAIKKGGIVSVMEIGEYAFANAPALTEISFSKNCRMGEGALFGNTSLEKVIGAAANLPDLYNYGGSREDSIIVFSPVVGEGAYTGSSSSSIGIGKDVVEIKGYAFASMPNLKAVDVKGVAVVPVVDEKGFAENDLSKITLYVDNGDTERWRSAPVWRDFIISESASTIDETLRNGSVEVNRNGSVVTLSAPALISDVNVFSTDGRLLIRLTPNEETAEFEFPSEEEVVLIKVAFGKDVSVVKLMK